VNNSFPVNAAVTATYTPGVNNNVFKPMTDILVTPSDNRITSSFPVLFRTQDFNTTWNISVILGVMPASNFLGKLGQKFTNTTLDLVVPFDPNTMGNTYSLTLNGLGIDFSLSDYNTMDTWVTPSGYNRVTFISLTNDFVENINSAVLKHQYDTDANYLYTIPPITSGTSSSQYTMVEFNVHYNNKTIPSVLIFLA